MVQMLHLDQLKNVLSSWLDFLSRYSSRQSSELMLAYDSIVRGIGAIVYAQGVYIQRFMIIVCTLLYEFSSPLFVYNTSPLIALYSNMQ